jgi:hypothetical protein
MLEALRKHSGGTVVPFPPPELGARPAPPHSAPDLGDGGEAVVMLGLCLVVGGAVLLVAIQALLILRTL